MDCCLREEINHGVFNSAYFLSKPSRPCPRHDSCQEIWQNRNCKGHLPQLSGSQLQTDSHQKWLTNCSEILVCRRVAAFPEILHTFRYLQKLIHEIAGGFVLLVSFFHFRPSLFHHSRHWRIYFMFKLNTEYGILAIEKDVLRRRVILKLIF